ncbi:MAG: hypothetical protein ABFC24_01640 [Methanoregulaceae archaeon]
MVDVLNYTLISVAAFCFGLIISFQLAHIHYSKRLIHLVRRSVDSRTIAPVLAELESARKK